MQKIIICFPSDHYKKYFDFKAFIELEKKFDVTYLLNKEKYHSPPPESKKFIYYKTTHSSDVKYMRFIHLSMIKNRNKSKTFNYQFRRWYPNFYDFFQKSNQHNWETKKYKRNIIDKYPIDNEIYKIVQEIQPDLIIYPSHCFEPETIKLVRISKKIDKKILFIIDNWDNLSSKTVFFEKPDAITVWGNQSKKHAEKIQDMKKKNIFFLGSPKFDNYFKLRKKKI